MTSNNKKDRHTFDAPKSEKFIGNHLEKIFAFFLIVPISLFLIKEINTTVLIFCIFFYITIMLIFQIIQQKFAYKISIDLGSQKIQFHMYRSKEFIEICSNQLDTIRINGYVIFKLHDRTIFYKNLQNNELFECLNQIKKIEWGILCNIWGPNKEIRDKFKFDG